MPDHISGRTAGKIALGLLALNVIYYGWFVIVQGERMEPWEGWALFLFSIFMYSFGYWMGYGFGHADGATGVGDAGE